MRNSLRHESLLAFFCKLGRELYCIYDSTLLGKVSSALFTGPRCFCLAMHYNVILLVLLYLELNYLQIKKYFATVWASNKIVKIPFNSILECPIFQKFLEHTPDPYKACALHYVVYASLTKTVQLHIM